MLIGRPDSRYTTENLSEISTDTLCHLNESAEKMAYFPSKVEGLNAEWVAAYEATQTELLRRVKARR
jgi:hypothetical protein